MDRLGGRRAGRLVVSPEEEPARGYFFVFVPEIQSSSHHQAWIITKAVLIAIYCIYFI